MRLQGLQGAGAIRVVADPAVVLPHHGVHRAHATSHRVDLVQNFLDVLLERHGDTQSAEVRLKSVEEFSDVVHPERNVHILQAGFAKGPVVDQVAQALRHRIADHSENFCFGSQLVHPVHMFEGGGRDLTRRAFLAGRERPEGEEPAHHQRKNPADFPLFSHAQADHFFLFLAGPRQQFEHRQVVVQILRVSDDLQHIARQLTHQLIERFEFVSGAGEIVVRQDGLRVSFIFQNRFEQRPRRRGFDIDVLGALVDGLPQHLNALFFRSLELTALRFGTVGDDAGFSSFF